MYKIMISSLLLWHFVQKKLIYFSFGQTKNLSQLSQQRTLGKSVVSCQKCNLMIFTILFKQVINHLIAVSPRKVHVKIGWRFSIRIEEALKIQIQLNRVYICNAK